MNKTYYKYAYGLLGADGMAHARPINEDLPQNHKGRHEAPYSERNKREIEQCLNCKKKKCTGGWTCFGGEDGK